MKQTDLEGDGIFVVERLEDGRVLYKSAPAHKLILRAAYPVLFLLAVIAIGVALLVLAT